ncbi:type II toxin-antitoxin system VapC family toxin [Infirmifilum sp. SLHALR2]|nr:MAG: hypothetical protein B7L53_09325 [Thermofilum sp. NZ13]
MKIFLDSSVFLKLLLDEPGAEEAQEILEAVESGGLKAYITPLVLEEVSFKLLLAQASYLLGTANVWRIRQALREDEALRAKCFTVLEELSRYIEKLSEGGLRVEPILHTDWLVSTRYVEKYGLLPADAMHVAVASRLSVSTIATFDEDFKHVKGIKVIP